MSPSSTAPARVAFRVDSSIRLGSGHVIRCLTLADELRKRGAQMLFICREHPGNLIARIEQEGHAVRRLPLPGNVAESSILGAPAADDASDTAAALAAFRPHWLVTDHYGTAGQWERSLALGEARLFVIDDFDRDHPAGVVLNQNWRADGAGWVADAGQVRLTGPRYALLRADYAALHRVQSKRGGNLRRVLVFFGGSDPTDETSKALAALSLPPFDRLAVDVVIGANHPDPGRMQHLAASRPATTLHRALPSLAQLMAAADLAIGAGGATTWERLCVGVPSVVTTIAENQELGTSRLAAHGIVKYVGRSEQTTVDSYAQALADPPRAPEFAARLVDGLGALRVAELIVPTAQADLRLRRATMQDAEALFEWRNEPTARAMSYSSDPVSWSGHVRWLEARLASPHCLALLAEAQGLPVGQVRFDIEADRAVLSYALDVLVRGRGWSHWLVDSGVQLLRRQWPTLAVHAHVKVENSASRRVFSRLGWQERHDERGLVYVAGSP